jgi:hypothetical protein
MMAALLLLTAMEEIVVGQLHHRGSDGTLAELVDGRWAEVAASMLLLWLILLPHLAYRRLHLVLHAEASQRFLRGGIGREWLAWVPFPTPPLTATNSLPRAGCRREAQVFRGFRARTG